jgi:hypothetical protein
VKRNAIAAVIKVLFTTLSVWTFTFVISLNRLSAASTDRLNQLAITLQLEKQSYILGEPVSITFKVTNNSNARIELPGLVEVGGGTIVLRIAADDGAYRLYRGPGWYVTGRKTLTPPMLDPGSIIERTVTVLHNRAPKRGTLNEQTWKRITEQEIDTEIALPKPGRYHFKAVLFGKIESPPLEIYVTEPQKIDDIEIWKLISSQPKYALFMQSGDLLQGTLTDQRTNDMVDALEAFVNYHATSAYTPLFRAAIAKHRADVERHLKAAKPN